jgi:DNA-binding SARP family transcriptional activator
LALHVELLGPPRIRAEPACSELPSDLPGALLAALVVHGDWVLREWLLALFWPDASVATAQHNLRVNLHRLRCRLAALGCGGALRSQAGQLRLDAASDVAQFRSALAAGNPAAALQCRRGALLPGWSLRGFGEFDTWIGQQRESLALAHRQAVMQQAAMLEAAGDAVGAAALLIDTLRDDPLAEDMLQALLQVAADAGQAATALLLYERFRQRAFAELGVAPLAATQRLVRALHGADLRPPAQSSAPVPAPAASVDTPPWVGREEEQRWLRAQARRCLVVRGEPGAGKTRLVQQVHGTSALWLRCRAGARDDALAPVVRCLEHNAERVKRWPRWQASARLLARVCPALLPGELAPPAPARATPQLPALLADLLAWFAEPIIVDDLQWADAATLAVLRRLHERADVRIAATLRSGPLEAALSTWLDAAQAEGTLQQLDLPALPRAALSSWADWLGVGAHRRDSLCDWLHRRSGGNPFLALETLRSLIDAGRLLRDGEHWVLPQWPIDTEPLPLPQGALRAVQSRVAALGDACRRLLAVAAVAGDAADSELLGAIADLSPWQAAGAVAEAQRAGLLRERQFAHDLVRDAIVQQLDEPSRTAIHAGIVARAGSVWPPERLAAHGWAAGRTGDAVELTVVACRNERSRGLHAQAAERAERALGHALPPALAARLACDRAQTAFDLGDAAQARLWLERVHGGLPEPRTRALALVIDADLALLEGRAGDAQALADEAAAACDDLPEVQSLRGVIAHQRGDHDAAAAAFAAAVAAHRRKLPSVALADALTNLGAAHDAAGRPQHGLPHHEHAWALAQRLGARHLQVRIAVNLMDSLRQLGCTGEALAVGKSALALGRYDGTASVLNNLAGTALQAGALGDARRWSERLADDRDPSLRCLSRARLLRISALQGDRAGVARWAPRVLDAMAQTDLYLPRAAAIASLLDHADPSTHAPALEYLREEPLPPAVQAWLDSALARRAALSGSTDAAAA